MKKKALVLLTFAIGVSTISTWLFYYSKSPMEIIPLDRENVSTRTQPLIEAKQETVGNSDEIVHRSSSNVIDIVTNLLSVTFGDGVCVSISEDNYTVSAKDAGGKIVWTSNATDLIGVEGKNQKITNIEIFKGELILSVGRGRFVLDKKTGEMKDGAFY